MNRSSVLYSCQTSDLLFPAGCLTVHCNHLPVSHGELQTKQALKTVQAVCLSVQSYMHNLIYHFNLPLQGGCITKLEQFLANHLLVIGAVGIGVACLQVSEI